MLLPAISHWQAIIMYCDGEYYPCDEEDSFNVGLFPSKSMPKDPKPRVAASPLLNRLLAEAFESIPGDSYQAKLDTLNKCNCCLRHKTNRPSHLAPWVETQFHGCQDTPCACSCRHMARFICRQISTEFKQKPMLERWQDDIKIDESSQ